MKKSRFGSLILGSFLIFLGVAFMLDSMGITSFSLVFSQFWPLFVIALSVSRFLVGDWKGGTIMGVIGIVAQLNALGFVTVNVWSIIWPSIIILFGISIIVGLLFDSSTSENTTLNEMVLFSGLERQVTQQAFEGGNIVTLFGGSNIDLTNAVFKDGKAVMDVFVAFGGVEIIAPPEVNVEIEVMAIFGGSSDNRPKSDVKQFQTLKVRGYALFGGFEVKAKAK